MILKTHKIDVSGVSKCSLCGPAGDVAALSVPFHYVGSVTGGHTIIICEHCVTLCAEIIEDMRKAKQRRRDRVLLDAVEKRMGLSLGRPSSSREAHHVKY